MTITEKQLIEGLKTQIIHLFTIVNGSHYKKSLVDILDNETNIKESADIALAIISDNYTERNSNVLAICLDHVFQTMTEITTLICAIDEEFHRHAERYFSYWRNMNITNEILRLKKCESMLQVRVQRLMIIVNGINVAF
jgi:hypothetical protein